MKTYKFFSKNFAKMLAVAFCSATLLGVSSCEEEVDSSNFAIKTDQTLTDIVDGDQNLSLIRDLFKRVKLGRSENASSIYSVLSARGNYTVFVPDNVAVEKYLKSLGLTSIDELTDEQAELIAFSCVIDNGDQEAYQSTDFPAAATFNLSNLYDRLLDCAEVQGNLDTVERVKYDSFTQLPVIENGDTVKIKYPVYYKIEKNCGVIITDLEASNGWMHVVADVIAPTSDYTFQVIQDAPNMKIMGRLLQETGVWEWMNVERDVAYEETEIMEPYLLKNIAPNGTALEAPMKRYLSFTGFVEPDSIFLSKMSGVSIELDEEGVITNWDEILPKLYTISEIATAYGSDSSKPLTDLDNPLNKFVRYHFIDGKYAPGKLVVHYTEYLYKYGNDAQNPQTREFPTDAWDYYTTIHPSNKVEVREPMKLLQVGERGTIGAQVGKNIYINRFPVYDNGMFGTYEEIGVKQEGVQVLENQSISAANGYVYPITDLLVFGDTERTNMGLERMRVDFTTIIHELSSNNLRNGTYKQFPLGYFENAPKFTSSSHFLYLMCSYAPNYGMGGTGWCNYQGDELMISGLYDVTFRIPPVPAAKDYEIRLGVSHNSLRGMCQLYFGEDMNRLQPAGLPYDMRQSSGGVSIPWVEDVEDEATNMENDQNLRNQNFMKGPKHFGWTDGTGERMARAYNGHIRRIVTTAHLEPNKSYYLRYKSALNKLDSQLQIDYIEIVPNEVYAGNEAEDVW